jgi:cytoskeleton protein RodZ
MSVGAEFQRARGERKLSLAEVSQQTKIQGWVLEALESDRLLEMMSPVYVKGFVTTYAKYLHLDPAPLLARLSWPTPTTAQAEFPPVPVRAAPAASQAAPQPWKLPWRLPLGALSAALATLALIVFFSNGRRNQVFSVANSPTLMRLAAHPERPAKQAKKTSPTRVAAQMATSVKPASPSSVSQAGQATLASVVPIGPSAKPAAPPPLALASSKPLEVVMTIRRTTWAQVRADGKLLAQQRLEQGTVERWTAKKLVELVVAKPADVELTLNGTPVTSQLLAYRGRMMITHRGVTQLPD